MRAATPRLVLTLALGLFAGCGSSDDDAGGAGGDGLIFEGGDYQLYVQAVDDGCLDGSLEIVFMPGGTEQDYALQNRTRIPSLEEVPVTYPMTLAEPFSAMEITVAASGPRQLAVTDGEQSAVPLGLVPGGNCTVDMSFDGTIDILGARRIGLDTRAELRNFTSPTGHCPEVEASPCEVRLQMYGALD